MLSRIPFRLAINLVLTILGLVVMFHMLVLLGVIPYTIVWGGRIQGESQMKAFEAVSITINIIMMLVIATRGGYIGNSVPLRLLQISVWLFFFIFALNTIGNLFAETTIETIVFTPLTLILAIMCYRIAREKYQSFTSVK